MEIQIRKKQLEDIGQFYELIKSNFGIIETFYVKPNGIKSTRFYENKKQFINDVVAYNYKGFTCYAGLQPRKKELLNGNRSATNKDVTAIRFLYLDIDPVRPAKVNATDQEKQICLDHAIEIQKKFQNGYGYQSPILTSSGNGNWLLAAIRAIKITDDNRSEISAKLKSWGANFVKKYSTEGIKIDGNTYDLRRITKIPGTKIFNSPDTPSRPQRISEIISGHDPVLDEKLRKDFLSLPVEIKDTYEKYNRLSFQKPFNSDRIFDKCYTIRFLKEKGESGANISHHLRLACSTFSIALGDLDNDLYFIKQIIGRCPDFNENTTRYFLEKNQGKSSPYGCQKLKLLAEEHFSDFESERCNCSLAPSFNPETNQYRKPSPIRFAFLLEEDLNGLFYELEFSEDKFKNYKKLKKFTHECLTSFDRGTSKVFLESKKKELKLRVEDIKNILDYRQKSIDLSISKNPQPELSEEDKEKALAILKKPSLLYDYGKFIQSIGVVGEVKNILIVLLSLTSRLMASLISLVIKAESSSGKSHLLKNCLKAFPEEYNTITTMTNKVLELVKDNNDLLCENKKFRLCDFGISFIDLKLKYELLHRVFNIESFDRGGRFYGAGHLELPKEIRKQHLTINGSPTVELDFSALHIRMLYHLIGIPYMDDPYTILCDSEEERKIFKLAQLIAINALDENKAIKAIRNEFRKKGIKYDLTDESIGKLLTSFKEAHYPIAKYINAGKGRELQNLDSQITEIILVDLMNKNIPVLPVHDSYILEKAYHGILAEKMDEAYEKVMGFTPVIG